MISEVTLAKKFTSFWNQLLPNANNFIRLINGGLVQACYEPFENTKRKENISLINILSFIFFKSVVKNDISLDFFSKKLFFSSDYFKNCLSLALAELNRYSININCSLPLNKEELEEILILFRQIYARYHEHISTLEVSPVFKGCGFINQSEGDIYFHDTLVELKSGERKFSVTDIRQILIYCTLNYYSNKEKRQIENIELFNPRMGLVYQSKVKDLSENLSSLSPEDLFFEIQSFISENNFVETHM